MPSTSVLLVMDQLPLPSAVVVPTTPSMSDVSVTVVPTTAVPASVGVVTFVVSSVLLVPESLATSRSGALGAAGAVVSMVI